MKIAGRAPRTNAGFPHAGDRKEFIGLDAAVAIETRAGTVAMVADEAGAALGACRFIAVRGLGIIVRNAPPAGRDRIASDWPRAGPAIRQTRPWEGRPD